MVALILSEKTVNLWKLKAGVGRLLGNTQTDVRSHYQRIKRWLWTAQKQKRMWIVIVKHAWNLLGSTSKILIIDGSSWKSGGVYYHFLTLSILHKGVSIPIWWLDLDRAGQSSQWQRKLLFKTALKVFNLKGMHLLADREYVGSEWIKWLKDKQIDIVLRLRATDYLAALNQKGTLVSFLESKAKARLGTIVSKQFIINDATFTFVLVAYRNRSGKIEFLRLLTTLSALEAVEAYKKRYRIETMFKHLKSNGFDWQTLNVKFDYKVNLMMATLVLAYTLAVVYGLEDFKQKIKEKKHGCPEISVFRWGLEKWQNHLQDMVLFLDKLIEFWKIVVPNLIHTQIPHVP